MDPVIVISVVLITINVSLLFAWPLASIRYQHIQNLQRNIMIHKIKERDEILDSLMDLKLPDRDINDPYHFTNNLINKFLNNPIGTPIEK